MITRFDVRARIVDPPVEFSEAQRLLLEAGDSIGRARYGSDWEKRLYPSSEKLRICRPPKLSDGTLHIDLSPYQWANLEKMRQLQPVGNYGNNNPEKYYLNAVCLAANAVIETSDGNLVFHRKRGGAKHGSIHTFGAYVEREHVAEGKVDLCVADFLGKPSELGLSEVEMGILGFFGTETGMPSFTWHYGTAGVYARVRTPLTAEQLRERVGHISAEQTLNRELVVVPRKNINSLLEETNVHPQTAGVLTTMIAIYADET